MLKVVTWNVNSIRTRLDRAKLFLERHSPNVVCLQELKCLEDKFPKEEFLELGYQSVLVGQKTYNGVAILSNLPIESSQPGFDDPEFDPEARIISAKIKGVNFLSAYIPNGREVGHEKYIYKLQWLQRLKEFLQTNYTADDSVVLVGDFNVAPKDIDVYDPDSWEGRILCSEPERDALDNVKEFGLADAFRIHHKNEVQYSWWDYRQLGFQKNHGLRIDHIYITRNLVDQCVSCEIDREERKGEKPSDHAPVIAELDI